MKDSDLWETGNKLREPYDCPSLLPKESSGSRMGWRNWGRARKTSWLRRWAKNPGKPRKLEFIGHSTRGRTEASLKYLVEYTINASMWGNYPRFKRTRKNSARHSHGQDQRWFPSARLENLIIHGVQCSGR